MFGGVNQLLAALALLTLTSYLKKQGGKGYIVTLIPCIFMLIMTIWAVSLNQMDFVAQKNWLLAGINGGTLLLSFWMVIESIKSIVFKLARK
jgi:carbon starvation protein